MSKKEFKLTLLLEVLSVLFVVLGMIILVSCGATTVTTTTDTSTVKNQTIDVDTTYANKVIDIVLLGDSSKTTGDYINVQILDSIIVRDSITIRDSVVVRYKYLTKSNVKINHPPIYAFTKYGYAKAWMYNNLLNVSMIINDGTIKAKIDSAIMVIKLKELNTSTTVTTTDSVKVKGSVWNSIKNLVIWLVILLSVGLLGYIIIKVGVKLRK